MSPAFLFLDLLALALGLPLLWTLRSMAEPVPVAAGGARRSGPSASTPAALPSAEERRLMRGILDDWHRLSAADVMLIEAASGAPELHVTIAAGSPGASFWTAAAALGWARRVRSPEAIRRGGAATETFALTGAGCGMVPDFRRRYDLVFGTSYAAAERAEHIRN
jgi:hypothetical protein